MRLLGLGEAGTTEQVSAEECELWNRQVWTSTLTLVPVTNS